MKFPSPPKDGLSIAESYRELLRYLKATQITGVAGGLLKQSPNGTTLVLPKSAPSRVSQSGGRFIVSFSGSDLYVSRGSTFAVFSSKRNKATPIEPTIDDVTLADNPSFDVSEKPDDVLHEVWCIINEYNYRSKIKLIDPITEPLVLENNENSVLIAEVTFKSEGDTRSAVIEQIWESDIPWFRAGSSYSSAGSDDSDIDDSAGSDSESKGSGSNDSSGGDESQNSASSDISSSEGSSAGFPCPSVSGVFAVLFAVDGVVGASCIADKNDNAAADDLAYLTYHVYATVSASPEGCRLYARATITSASGTYYLGLSWGGGEVMIPVTFMGFPSTSYEVSVTVFKPIGFPGTCDLQDCTPSTATIISPPGCSA